MHEVSTKVNTKVHESLGKSRNIRGTSRHIRGTSRKIRGTIGHSRNIEENRPYCIILKKATGTDDYYNDGLLSIGKIDSNRF